LYCGAVIMLLFTAVNSSTAFPPRHLQVRLKNFILWYEPNDDNDDDPSYACSDGGGEVSWSRPAAKSVVWPDLTGSAYEREIGLPMETPARVCILLFPLVLNVFRDSRSSASIRHPDTAVPSLTAHWPRPRDTCRRRPVSAVLRASVFDLLSPSSSAAAAIDNAEGRSRCSSRLVSQHFIYHSSPTHAAQLSPFRWVHSPL